jgi:WD40 repeat protein/serine/threonine protein kinase
MGEPSSEQDPVEALVEEFLERQRRGERPDVAEYARRYPEWADRIRKVFRALALMEDVRPAEASGSVAGLAASPAAPELQRLGDFRILREVGRGGMGVVYEAEQVSLGRHVALKVLPHQLPDDRARRRFEREAKAAAKLHHTNIVPVFGVGEHDGLPYYAMQFIQGLGLDGVIAELKRLQTPKPAPALPLGDAAAADVARSLLTGHFAPAEGAPDVTVDHAQPRDTDPAPPRPSDTSALSGSSAALPGAGRATYWQSVARIGVQVADALEHAHKQGVLHRDVKPSNLLLDRQGTVWVTDFGLAKAHDQPDLTHSGDVLGTLRYMPPEAFDGKADARGDVYSLGLTLYELLALRPAFDETDRHKLIKQVTAAVPPRLGRLNAAVPRDLATVVEKAIDRDPARRYPTAGALAADLQRFLDDVPIRARRVGRVERLGRWCRRNPAVAGLTVAVLLLFVAGFAGVTWNYWQAEAARRELETNLYVQRIALAYRELSVDNLGRAQELLDECPVGLRQWEWHYLKRLCRVEPTVLSGGAKEVYAAAFRPDGGRLAAAHGDGTIDLFDVETGERYQTLRGHTKVVFSVAFHPDGRRLASASADGTVKVWDVTTSRVIHTHPGNARGGGESWMGSGGVAFSPDGHLLAAAGREVSLVVWEVDGGREVFSRRLPEGFVSAVAFSPDGRFLASAHGGGLRLWDVRTWQLLHEDIRAHNLMITAMAFRPDGKRIATASYDRSVKVWDVTTGNRLRTLPGQSRTFLGVAYSPDGRRLATCGEDTMVRLWDADADTDQELLILHGHTFFCLGVTFSSDGRRLASAGLDGTVRIWDASPLTGGEGLESLSVRHGGEVWSVAFSPNGQQIASGSHDGTVRIWDGTRGAAVREFPQLGKVYRVAFSPDGKYLGAATAKEGVKVGTTEGLITVWDVATAKELASIPSGFPPCAAFSPDSRSVLGWAADDVSGSGAIHLWDVQTGRATGAVGRDVRPTWCLAFSPDGRRLASAGLDWKVKVWEWDPVRPGKAQEPKRVLWARVNGFTDRVAFYPDGQRLVTGGEEQGVKVWDASTGREIQTLHGHTGDVYCVAVSPDGRWIASAGVDTTIRLWDAATGKPLHKLRGHTGVVSSLAFRPDSPRLVSGSRDQTVKVWDLTRLDKKRQ